MLSKSVRRVTVLARATLALLATAGPLSAQTGMIRGTVTDSTSGMPIAGAMVTLEATDVGVLTGANGVYLLNNVAPGSYTIAVEHIGFGRTTSEVLVAAGATAVVDFALAPSVLSLSELVVVGYGRRSRLEITSAVATVQSEELVNVPVASVDAALQGQASGVQVVQNSGNPGNAMTVRVRGSASISASNQPLYVVDGVPILQEDFSQLGIGGQDLSAITGLNPDEIESIDILKDASAAAIYGSRGSNGVVLITTHRGRTGAPRATFGYYTGWQEAERQLDLLNASQYVEFMNEAAENDGEGTNLFGVPGVTDRVDTDWQEAVLRTAPVANYTASLSGGTERIRYYLSGSFFDQEGIVVGSEYSRASGRVNLDFDATERLTLRTSIGVSHEDNDIVQGDGSLYGPVPYAIAETPVVAPYTNTGSFSGPDDGLIYYNPIALGELNPTEARTLRSLGNLEADFRIMEGLSVTGRAGYDVINVRELQWQSPLVEGTYPETAGGVSKFGYSSGSRYLLESFGNWDLLFERAGHLTLTGGGSVELNDWDLNFIRGEGFSNIAAHQISNAAIITEQDGDLGEHNLISMFSRAHYSLNDRYFATASLRRDGSSRFGPNHRWGVFPALSAGWLISAEPFLADMPVLSTLRLRASWGETGNEEIGDYQYQGLFRSDNYGETPGITQSNIANPDLRWETTRELNLGFDAGLLDDRVTVGVDLYDKTTDDLLLDRPVTATSGFTSVLANVGEMKNSGWELTLGVDAIRPAEPDGFRWHAEFNIAHNDNEVTELFNDQPFDTGIRGVNRVEVGEPLGAFHVLRFEGVDPATGDAIYFDANGDGEITASDDVIVGSPHPDYYGGLTNTLGWGPLDLKIFVSFTQGAEIFNAMRIFQDDGGYSLDNKFVDVMDRWQQPGDQTDVPRASLGGNSSATEISDRWVEDGSYVRIQEVTLGYLVPTAWGDRVNLTQARLFASVRNLHTFTDFTGYSPDVNSNGADATSSLGTDFYAYPIARTFTFGVSAAL